MNITKEQADRVTVLAVRIAVWLPGESETGRALKNDAAEIADIMRGLAEDAGAVKCWCSTCRPITITDMRMVVCPDCGNKRCPKATDHRFLCTNSNESGQTGSSYTSSKSAHAETRNLASIYSKHDSYPVYIGDKHVMTVHATSPQAAQTEADELLRKWNLDPDLYRTDSGALNHMKIAAALKHPDDYPHTAQTAVKSESLAQAAQALAQPPSEGKTIEALAPVEIKPDVLYELKPGGVHVFKAQTEAALREVVRLSEDAGLYGADFQTGRAGSKP